MTDYYKYLDYFPIPLDETKLITLTGDGKGPAGAWDEHPPGWIPFVHPTAIRCNYYEHLGLYLCCLDWDYKSKFDNPIWKKFEYTDTLVRESKNGLHAFYLSPEPCKFKEKKSRNGGLDIDFKMIRAHNLDSNGGYVKYHPGYTDNGMEALEIDINEVISSLYKQNNVPLEEAGSYSGKRKPISEEYVVTPYVEALAQYFYYKETSENPLWEDGHHIAFEFGLKLGGYIETSKEARGFAIRLMELATVYDSPRTFVENFLNGWACSDDLNLDNFGGKKLTKLGVNFFIKQNWTIEEYAKKMHKYNFNSYLTVIKTVLKYKR